MDRAERRDRMQRMRRQVMENNIYRWAANVLGALREIRLEDNTSGESAASNSIAIVPSEPAQRRLA
jgi:trehalose-6-phosphate synthase